MRHLDLFSGIGGFALAARRVGWKTVQFVEIDPYCQKVLAKNFPGVPIHDDIETFTAGPADVITAGWPCQDISLAGKGAGLDGERSGLWKHVARILSDVRPRYAVLENVSALLGRGLDRVAGELAEIGYDCEWHCIPAAAIGAPHRRDRIWIIAYPCGDRVRHESGRVDGQDRAGAPESQHNGAQEPVADTDRRRQKIIGVEKYREQQSPSRDLINGRGQGRSGNGAAGPYPGCKLLQGWQPKGPDNRSQLRGYAEWWATEPDVGRVADGIPRRVDRLKGLGNAIVPQIAQLLFESINRS